MYKQVVNGINYKIIYQTPCGLAFYIICADIKDESVTIIDKGNLPLEINDDHLWYFIVYICIMIILFENSHSFSILIK